MFWKQPRTSQSFPLQSLICQAGPCPLQAQVDLTAKAPGSETLRPTASSRTPLGSDPISGQSRFSIPKPFQPSSGQMLHRHRALPGTQPGQCSGKTAADSGSGPGLAALSSPPEKERGAFMERAAQGSRYAGEWLDKN